MRLQTVSREMIDAEFNLLSEHQCVDIIKLHPFIKFLDADGIC